MRIFFPFLFCIFALTDASAADKLIRLSKSINFDPAGQIKPAAQSADKSAVAASANALAKTDAPAIGKEIARTEAAASAKEVAKNDKPASAMAHVKEGVEAKSAAANVAAAYAREEQAQKDLSDKITARLAAIRKEKGSPKPVRASASDHARREKIATAKDAESPSRHSSMHWGYEGHEAPEHWGTLNSAWAKCSTGTRQSPIDIHGGLKVDLEPVKFDYKPANFNVLDNGHTIQVTLGAGNRITVMGRSFELVQFHFHRPSEERVNGKTFQMVIHLVHKNAEGKLAVVALLIEEGVANNVVQSVWNNLPLEKNDPVAATTTMDVSQLLPEHRDYYTYMGSLTTPPCSEEVLWIVLKEPIKLSAQQIAIFTRLYPMNARPIQSNSARMIKESS